MLLGLDLGTSRIKALLLDGEGTIRGQSVVPTPFVHGEMTVEQLLAGVAGAIGPLGGLRSQVAAVGLAGMAESGAPLAGDGGPLAPIIAWHDPRGTEVVDRLRREFGPQLERDIGQRLRVVSSVAKLGWLVDHAVGPVSRWLGVPELILRALTGEQMTDFSLAARTGAYHLLGRCYRSDVAVALGVPRDVFPAVAAAGTPMGRVLISAGERFGLPGGIPVTIAGHDHMAARAGSGAGGHDWVNSVGTAETVTATAPSWPDVDMALTHRVAVTVTPAGDGWAVLASAIRSGMVLEAVAGALGASLAELDLAATTVGAAPAADDVVAAALSGSPLPLGTAPAGVIWRGVLTTLATRTWDACDRLTLVAAAPQPGARRLVACGGGSRSLPWLRAKAAARPTTAVWRSQAAEAVARGAALYAGVAAQWWLRPEDGPQPVLEAIASASPPPWPGGRS